MKLCIVIPARNEAASIADVVRRACQFGSVIVADDGSYDNTAQLAANAGADVFSVPVFRRGLAGVYQTGMLYAYYRESFDYYVELDAGGSHRPEDLAAFISQLDGRRVVFGRRFGADAVYSGPWTRRLLSWLGTVAFNYLKPARFQDATSGFIAYPSAAVPALFSQAFDARGHYYQTEVRSRVIRNKLAWREVPISFTTTKSSLRLAAVFEAIRLLWSDVHP